LLQETPVIEPETRRLLGEVDEKRGAKSGAVEPVHAETEFGKRVRVLVREFAVEIVQVDVALIREIAAGVDSSLAAQLTTLPVILVDFERLYRLHTALAFFVIRTKENLAYRRRYSHQYDRATGVRSDQTIILTGPKSATLYPIALRRVHFYSVEREQRLVLLTNNFSIPAFTVAALYRYRWQIELFFKWIKQHLRIKSFFGTSDNSVKTQIWIAVTVYVLVALVKKRLGLKQDLYTLLQIFSLTLFEKNPILGLLQQSQFNLEMLDDVNQLQLLDI